MSYFDESCSSLPSLMISGKKNLNDQMNDLNRIMHTEPSDEELVMANNG